VCFCFGYLVAKGYLTETDIQDGKQILKEVVSMIVELIKYNIAEPDAEYS
jgi:hypothetical protein